MDEKIVIKLDEIPKGSRLEKYLKDFSETVKEDAHKFVPLMKKGFRCEFTLIWNLLLVC